MFFVSKKLAVGIIGDQLPKNFDLSTPCNIEKMNTRVGFLAV